MCFTLRKIYVNSEDGPVEYPTGIETIILNCPVRPADGRHRVTIDTFLSRSEVHAYILRRMTLSNVPLSLLPVQRRAHSLLPRAGSTIYQMIDCTFFFSHRWYENGQLCGIFQNGMEHITRVDADEQAHGPMSTDLVESSTTFQNTPITNQASLIRIPSNWNCVEEAFSYPPIPAAAAESAGIPGFDADAEPFTEADAIRMGLLIFEPVNRQD